MSLMDGVQHLKIPLEEIKLATNNFGDENFIARGGFGRVYIGKLTLFGQQITVAVKRLDRKLGQGDRQFLVEIQMLSCYRHTNLITLVGFCDEGGESILVYEHAKQGSLDNHLSDDGLSWMQRLQISVGAARGFDYLHNQVGPQHRVLHRDIKSSNILLDENWEAKISDFGLSKIGPSNVAFTFLVTDACGTIGYMDPQYVKTGILTKESDVYSFGVVLFELLCGRVAYITQYQDVRSFLASLAQQYYENNRLDEIIHPSLKNQMKAESLKMFSMVAYRCLKENRKKRPTMGWVVENLEKALELQKEDNVKTKALLFGRMKMPMGNYNGSGTGKLVFVDGSSDVFDFEDLNRATAKILRKDDYATTYEAVLEDGKTVAVKRLKEVVVAKNGFEQQMEMILSIAKHPNVVPLLAYYYSNGEKLLVYDGATFEDDLSSLLHGNRASGKTLDWETRYRVALGTAKGIAHIHAGGDEKLTHGNIRSSNVLLNQDKHGRIVDFGLTPLVGILTISHRGYHAPEVIVYKQITQKSDVYSFGVLMLELLTGKAPVQLAGRPDEGLDLPRWVKSVVREEWTAEAFDEELTKYQNVEEEMVQILQIAMACVENNPKTRPKMDEVVRMIQEIRMLYNEDQQSSDDNKVWEFNKEKKKMHWWSCWHG